MGLQTPIGEYLNRLCEYPLAGSENDIKHYTDTCADLSKRLA